MGMNTGSTLNKAEPNRKVISGLDMAAVKHCPLILVKGKAIPSQAWSGPEGSRKLRFPDFMARKVVRLSVLRTGRIYPQEMLVVLISVRV